MLRLAKKTIRSTLNRMGFDVIPYPESPRGAILRLRSFPICSVVDIGANTGQFAKMISGVFPHAHIYSFEPLPAPFEELRHWAQRRNGQVTAFNVALGDRTGQVEMLDHLDHSTSSSLLKTTDLEEELYPFTKKQVPIVVKIKTLDDAMADIPLSPDILLKLDVQGYEDRVVRGGEETFRKAKACILEVGLVPLYEDQASFSELVDLLHKLGYDYAGNLNQTCTEDGNVIFIDALFIKGEWSLL